MKFEPGAVLMIKPDVAVGVDPEIIVRYKDGIADWNLTRSPYKDYLTNESIIIVCAERGPRNFPIYFVISPSIIGWVGTLSESSLAQ